MRAWCRQINHAWTFICSAEMQPVKCLASVSCCLVNFSGRMTDSGWAQRGAFGSCGASTWISLDWHEVNDRSFASLYFVRCRLCADSIWPVLMRVMVLRDRRIGCTLHLCDDQRLAILVHLLEELFLLGNDCFVHHWFLQRKSHSKSAKIRKKESLLESRSVWILPC